MRAIQIERPGSIHLIDREQPRPGAGEVLVRVSACGVCRTDLHLLDGEVAIPHPPIIPGHQIVGTVVEAGGTGAAEAAVEPGMRVGIPWLGWTCGRCSYCRSGRENLCDLARFTGRDIDGGYAEYATADARFCFPLPEAYTDHQLAPLLCAGLIGYRALRMTGEAERLGLFGFGSSAHIIAFTRPGDEPTQEFARALGAEWAGDSDAPAPEELDAAIIFASAGELVPSALGMLAKGGVVVCAGIHMSDIPSFPYDLLWGERVVRSVANLTRSDAREFLELAPRVPVRSEVRTYALGDAPAALEDLRAGRFEGSAVIDLAR
jgi:propanol-preferring alcohol dehydrogenase